MGAKEDERYIMEQIIAGGSGSNVARTYIKGEGS